MISRSTCFLALIMASSQLVVSAQNATPVARIEVRDLKLEVQQTPQLQASNVVDKKWKPKSWLELAMELETKLPRDSGGRDGSLATMEVKYFVGVNQVTKEGKYIVLTGTVVYNNVPAGEANTLAFISPSTLKRVLLKDNAGKADVKAFGIEVRAGGEVLAVKSSTGSPWWVGADKQPLETFSYEDGAVLPKSKTPFAPFWGDYDVPASDK
jgi:hypothetical protein